MTAALDFAQSEVAERGRTTVADLVVEQVAAHAVTEVDGVGGSSRRVLGVDLGSVVRVSAKIAGNTAALDVRLSVVYPESVAETTRRVRAHLVTRVAELTGYTVSRVDMTVVELHTTTSPQRRVQ